MRKRTLLIAGLLLSAAVVSCGEAAPAEPASTGESPASLAETEAGSEEESSSGAGEYDPSVSIVHTVYPEPDFGDLDLTGRTFRIMWSELGGDYFLNEGMNGEIINDTVFQRNLKTEERFGITLAMTETESWAGDLKSVVMSGQPDYDMVYGMGDDNISLVTQGYVRDFCDVPYMDFSQGYWFPNLMERLACNGRLFVAPSDINAAVMGGTVVTFFNKRILSEYDLESPYRMVEDNTWTLENFLGMVRQVSRDLNGDGIMDENDEFGIGVHYSDALGTFISLLFGTGLRITAPDEEGNLVFAMDPEMVQGVIDQTSEVLKDGSVAIDLAEYYRRTGRDDRDQDIELFAEGHELFLHTWIHAMQGALREMEDDYGVAPIPKYEAEQDSYYHRAQVRSCFFFVPTTCGDLEKTGAVFTYMTWLSNQTVLPAYYEVTLKQKRTRDEESAKMLDLIHDTTNFDFGDLFTRMRFYLVSAYDGGSYARTVGATMKKLSKDLEKMVKKLNNLD